MFIRYSTRRQEAALTFTSTCIVVEAKQLSYNHAVYLQKHLMLKTAELRARAFTDQYTGKQSVRTCRTTPYRSRSPVKDARYRRHWTGFSRRPCRTSGVRWTRLGLNVPLPRACDQLSERRGNGSVKSAGDRFRAAGGTHLRKVRLITGERNAMFYLL